MYGNLAISAYCSASGSAEKKAAATAESSAPAGMRTYEQRDRPGRNKAGISMHSQQICLGIGTTEPVLHLVRSSYHIQRQPSQAMMKYEWRVSASKLCIAS